MPSLLTEDALTTSTAKISSTTSCTTRSLFALALHAFNLCVFLVVVVALLLLLSPAAVVILLPVACMAASVCLLCATTARLLAPSSVPPGRARDENRGGVRERRKPDCVEVDRARRLRRRRRFLCGRGAWGSSRNRAGLSVSVPLMKRSAILGVMMMSRVGFSSWTQELLQNLL